MSPTHTDSHINITLKAYVFTYLNTYFIKTHFSNSDKNIQITHLLKYIIYLAQFSNSQDAKYSLNQTLIVYVCLQLTQWRI